MDSRALLARARQTGILRAKRRKPLSFEAKRVLKALTFTLIAMLLGASFLFFLNTNTLAQRGYALRQLELQNSKFRTENESLKQKVLEAQSFKKLSEGKKVKKMETRNSFLYVPLKSELVVRSE